MKFISIDENKSDNENFTNEENKDKYNHFYIIKDNNNYKSSVSNNYQKFKEFSYDKYKSRINYKIYSNWI